MGAEPAIPPSVSLDALERKLQVRRRARADGQAGRPAADAAEPGETEREILGHLANVRARLEAARTQIAAQLETSLRQSANPPLDAAGLLANAGFDLSRAEGRRRAIHQAALKSATEAQSELSAFRRRHNRQARAAYPRSVVLAAALLVIAGVFEAMFSATLFADADPMGLIGGAAKAIGLSGANVTLGFFAGFLGLRYLQHVRPGLKAFGFCVIALALTGAIALNLYAATWRHKVQNEVSAPIAARAAAAADDARDKCLNGLIDDEKRARETLAAAEAAAEEKGLKRTPETGAARDKLRLVQQKKARCTTANAPSASLTQPAGLIAPQALILMMLGAGVFAFATLKSYAGFDDPYPEYGARDRAAVAAEEELAVARAESRKALEAPVAAAEAEAERAIAAAAKAAAAARTAYDSGADRIAQIEARLRREEESAAQLIALYRRENISVRTAPAPASFQDLAASPPQPDVLSGPARALEAIEASANALKRDAAAARQSLATELEAALARLDGAP